MPRKKHQVKHDTGARKATDRKKEGKNEVMQERKDINPFGKELFEAVLKQALMTKPPKEVIEAENPDYISPAEFARRNNISRQRISQLIKEKDPRIRVVRVGRSVYVDPTSIWVPVSEIQTVKVPKSYISVRAFAAKAGTSQKRVMELIKTKDKRIKYVCSKNAYFIDPTSKWRPWG